MNEIGTQVGQIDLGLNISQDQFNRQIKSIASGAEKSATSAFSGMGKKVGIAFGTYLGAKAIVGFTKSCLELGSNLSEVQNVVDTTFTSMSDQVNEFAKSAMTDFGLSETIAKKYVGTLGTMSKSMGFTEDSAYNMATAVTGLAGDVASFYNISSDEAYNKLKSIWTGETEAIKELGVVMTQTALDQYALNNGFGKTTAKMTEQEKVMLRYQYVLSSLSGAQGDFARTSDQWANQTRVLSLRFDQLKATLGQGFINLFTPIVRVINALIGRLQVLAEYFKSFTEWITGKKSETVSNVADDISGATDGMASATDGMADSADSAVSSAKKLKRELAGFDKITKLSDKTDNSTSGSSGSSGTGGSSSGISIGGSISEVATEMEKQTNSMVTNFKNAILELSDIVKSGFIDGLSTNFSITITNITTSIKSIGTSLVDIFTSDEVLSASSNWAKNTLYNLSSIAGSVVSIGASIAGNILGGISDSLDENKDYLKSWIVKMFDISTEIGTIGKNLAKSVADILDVLTGESATGITSSIVSLFTLAFTNVVELGSKWGRDLTDMLTRGIIENKDSIKTALENTFKPVDTVLGSFKDSVKKTYDELQKLYDDHVAPYMDSLASGWSDIFGGILDAYNTYLAPVFERIGDKLSELITNHIQPLASSFIELFGKLIDGVNLFWTNCLKPFLQWWTSNFVASISPWIELIADLVIDMIKDFIDGVKGVVDALNGLIDFIVGVFTGDWEKAWNGIKDTVSGIWDAIKGFFRLPDIEMPTLPDIQKGLSDTWDKVVDWWDKSKKSLSDVKAKASAYVATKWSDIQSAWNGLTSNIKDKTASMKARVGTTWSNISKAWGSLTGNVKDITRSFKAKVGTTWSNISKSWSSLTGNIKDKTAKFNAKVDTLSSTIRAGWTRLSDQFKDKTADFKVKLSTAVGDVKNFVNSVIKAVNDHLIAKLDFNIKAPKWLGGGEFGWKAPRIPMLANGGYVKANTPQLAVIGDNRHQGEVVAPENKLKEMAMEAVRASGKSGSDTVLLNTIIELLKKILEKDEGIYLDGESIKRNVVSRINLKTKATGRCEIAIT